MDALGRARRAVAWSATFDAHPLFSAVAPFAARFRDFEVFPSVRDVDRLLPESGVRFEESRPKGRAQRRAARAQSERGYDERIADGVVPTRAGSWHDLMNALVWAAFPRAKRALHSRQREIVARDSAGATARTARARSREGDALALFDEGGAVLMTREDDAASLARALDTRDDAALGALLASRRVRPVVFGHALFEHLALGRSAVRASAVVIVSKEANAASERELAALADAALALRLSSLAHPSELRSAYLEVLAPRAAQVSGRADSADR